MGFGDAATTALPAGERWAPCSRRRVLRARQAAAGVGDRKAVALDGELLLSFTSADLEVSSNGAVNDNGGKSHPTQTMRQAGWRTWPAVRERVAWRRCEGSAP